MRLLELLDLFFKNFDLPALVCRLLSSFPGVSVLQLCKLFEMERCFCSQMSNCAVCSNNRLLQLQNYLFFFAEVPVYFRIYEAGPVL